MRVGLVPRRGVSAMGDAFETLVLLMARVRILQRALRREERRLERKGKTQKLQLADGWPTITFLNLYLASVHVLNRGLGQWRLSRRPSLRPLKTGGPFRAPPLSERRFSRR